MSERRADGDQLDVDDGGRNVRFDLHVHTDASPCAGASPEAVVDAAVAAGLDGVAVTDHDTTMAVDAVAAAAPPDLTVVPGVEVTTTQGHVLGLGVEAAPEPNDPLSVIAAIHDTGGLAVLAHPFDPLRAHFDGNLAELGAAADGVETSNARCLRPAYNARAERFAREWGLAMTGGSDAHFPHEVGRAWTVCRRTAPEAIRAGETDVRGRGGYLSGHVATKLYEVFG